MVLLIKNLSWFDILLEIIDRVGTKSYDRLNDPNEMNNVYDDPNYSEL